MGRVLSANSPAVLAPAAQVAARGLGARSRPPVQRSTSDRWGRGEGGRVLSASHPDVLMSFAVGAPQTRLYAPRCIWAPMRCHPLEKSTSDGVWKRKKGGTGLSAIGCSRASLRQRPVAFGGATGSPASRGARRSLDRYHPLQRSSSDGWKKGTGYFFSQTCLSADNYAGWEKKLPVPFFEAGATACADRS
jgi:hypothetical protein